MNSEYWDFKDYYEVYKKENAIMDQNPLQYYGYLIASIFGFILSGLIAF